MRFTRSDRTGYPATHPRECSGHTRKNLSFVAGILPYIKDDKLVNRLKSYLTLTCPYEYILWVFFESIRKMHYLVAFPNVKKPQSLPPVQAKVNDLSENFDFERWSREVRTQLLEALQKRAANTQRSCNE